MDDLFADLESELQPEKLSPADEFLAKQRRMLAEREAAVKKVLTPEQMEARAKMVKPSDGISPSKQFEDDRWVEIKPHGLGFMGVTTKRFYHYEKEIDHLFKRENDKLYYNEAHHPYTPQEDVDFFFSSGSMPPLIPQEVYEVMGVPKEMMLPKYEAMPQGLKEAQERNNIRDHGQGILKKGDFVWADKEKKQVIFKENPNGAFSMVDPFVPNEATKDLLNRKFPGSVYVSAIDPYYAAASKDDQIMIVKNSSEVVAVYDGKNKKENEFWEDVQKTSEYFGSDVLIEENGQIIQPAKFKPAGDPIDTSFQAPVSTGFEISAAPEKTEFDQADLFDLKPEIRYIDPTASPHACDIPIEERMYFVDEITIAEAKERHPDLFDDFFSESQPAAAPQKEKLSMLEKALGQEKPGGALFAVPLGEDLPPPPFMPPSVPFIKLVIKGDPMAQKRHKSTNIHTNDGRSFMSQYDPSAGDKKDFLAVVQNNAPEVPLQGPLKVDIHFYFSRPKAHYGTGKKSGILKESAPTWHISKPDRDNLDKFVLDALKGLYWRDDCQVCAGELLKRYDESPRTEIHITQLQ